MKIIAMVSLLVVSSVVGAGDLVAVDGTAKGARQVVSLEYVPDAGETAFEFEYVLPSDASDVDVSKCARSVPATHSAFCDYRETEQKVLVIVMSMTNALLPEGGLDLGVVRYTAKAKPAGDRVVGLVVANERGESVPSRVHSK